jgi:hypothetical protein
VSAGSLRRGRPARWCACLHCRPCSRYSQVQLAHVTAPDGRSAAGASARMLRSIPTVPATNGSCRPVTRTSPTCRRGGRRDGRDSPRSSPSSALRSAGYLVEIRYGPSGDSLGYKVAPPGDRTAAGYPVYYFRAATVGCPRSRALSPDHQAAHTPPWVVHLRRGDHRGRDRAAVPAALCRACPRLAGRDLPAQPRGLRGVKSSTGCPSAPAKTPSTSPAASTSTTPPPGTTLS